MQLIGARAVQGVGAAMLMPGTLSILTVTSPKVGQGDLVEGGPGPCPRPRPHLGGYMVEHLGWESVFFLNVPIASSRTVAMRTVRESRSDEARGRWGVRRSAPVRSSRSRSP